MRDFQNDGGIRWADLLPPNKDIKTSSACGTAPTDYLLNAGRRSQIFKKASQSPQSDVGQKIKIKKETKDLGTETCAPGGSREGGNISTH